VTFNVTGCIGPNAQQWNQSAFTRIHQGLVAQLLALKKKPIIRYQGSSDLCRKLAEDINGTINREHSLFDFRV